MPNPYSDFETERFLIGAILVDYERVLPMLAEKGFRTEMLEDPRNRVLFNTMGAIYKSGKPIDLLSLRRRLVEKHNLELAGGEKYLGSLFDVEGRLELSHGHADQVIEKSRLRTIRDSFLGIGTHIENGSTAQEIVAKLMSKLSTCIDMKNIVSPDELHARSLQEAEDVQMRGTPAGLPSFLSTLTDTMGNYIPETMYVIAGRPSDGKSSWALCEAIHKAVIMRVPTAFVSMEMGEKLLREQMAGCMANVSAFAFRRGMYSPDQRQRMVQAFELLSKAPLFINDSRMTIEQTVAWLSNMVSKRGVRLVILDYIQLIKSSRGRGNLGRTEQVMEWSGELKGFFKKVGVSGIVLSQLSRQGIKLESVTPSAPMLEALRDSGAIEQDADVVVFVYKKPGEPMESFFSDKDWQSELSVAKNRIGPTGRTPVLFVRSRQKFVADHGEEHDWTSVLRAEERQGELGS
jgi:replicative DNA helicase